MGRVTDYVHGTSLITRFGVARQGKKYSADDVIQELRKKGTVATLSNNWKLKFSTVNGEQRIEILNTGFFDMDILHRIGALSEIIGSRERYFVPVGNNDVLGKIVGNFTVIAFDQKQTADDILDEAASIINSNIPDNAKLHFIHPSFAGFFASPAEAAEHDYDFSNSITEAEYRRDKNADSTKSLWQHLKEFGAKVWKGRYDIPELAGDNNFVYAQEQIRGLKRERQANVHEAAKRLHDALRDLTPDDFDLFERAMELRDLYETRESDPKASMPWHLNPDEHIMRDPVREEYAAIMEHVRKNKRVQEAMRKSDILAEGLRQKLIEAADNLGMFDVRDSLKRKHYFRHLVLEYYNAMREGKPHPTFKNPQRRGYMKHREGQRKRYFLELDSCYGRSLHQNE